MVAGAADTRKPRRMPTDGPAHSPGELPPAIVAVLADQSGAVALAQIVAAGYDRRAVKPWLRRRLLQIVLPGVYVDHTGDLTWQQRAWTTVLYAAHGTDARSAVLCGSSAVRAHEGPGKAAADPKSVEVAIIQHRRVQPQPAVTIRRVGWLDDEHVVWTTSPPRQRYEHALLELAIAELARGRHLDAVGVLTKAVGTRRTQAERLTLALSARLRTTERAWLAGVLGDLAAGTCSVLEHGYVTLVARAHGLPEAELQAKATSSAGAIYRDADYGLRVIELDGKVGHTTTSDRDRDFDRDLDATLDGKATTRLSWGQVFDRPCITAGKIARLLASDGWPHRPTPCSPACTAPAVFAGRAA